MLEKAAKEQPTVRWSIKWKLMLVIAVLVFSLVLILSYAQISSQEKILEAELQNRISLMRANLIERGKAFIMTLSQQVENDLAAFNLSGVVDAIKGSVAGAKEMKYGVVGSGVNMTSRIESYTVGGQILVSESVLKEAGEVLRVDGRREVIPKGSEGALTIFDIGGIGAPYHLALEEKEPDMVPLAREIALRYAAVGGKDVGRDRQRGLMSRLSKRVRRWRWRARWSSSPISR